MVLKILGKSQSPRSRVNREQTPAGVLGSGTWGPFFILHEEMSFYLGSAFLPGCLGSLVEYRQTVRQAVVLS